MDRIDIGDISGIGSGDVAVDSNIYTYTTTLQYLGTDSDENNIYKVSVNLNKKTTETIIFFVKYLWNDSTVPDGLGEVEVDIYEGGDHAYVIVISREPIRDIGLSIYNVSYVSEKTYTNINNYIILTPYIIKFKYDLIYMGRFNDSSKNEYKLNITFDEELPCPLAFNLTFAGEHNETINGFSNMHIIFQEEDITKSIDISSTDSNDPSTYGNIKLIENSYGNPYMISVEHKENESKFIYGIRLEITNTFIKCADSTPNRDIKAGHFKYDVHAIDVPDCDVNVFLHVNGYSADYWLIDNAYLSEDYSLYPEIPYNEMEELRNVTKDNFELLIQSSIDDEYLPYSIEKYVSNIPNKIQKDFTINLYIGSLIKKEYTLELDIKSYNTIDLHKYVYLYMTNQNNEALYNGFLILDGETTVKPFGGSTAVFTFTTDNFLLNNKITVNQIYIYSYRNFNSRCYDYVIDSTHSNIINRPNQMNTNGIKITPKFGVNNKEVIVSGPVYNYPKDIIYPFTVTTAKDKIAFFDVKLKAQETFIYSINNSNPSISKIRFNDDDRANLINTNTRPIYTSVNHTTGVIDDVLYYFVLRYASNIDTLFLEYYNIINNEKKLKILYNANDDTRLTANIPEDLILKVEGNRLFILGFIGSVIGVMDYTTINTPDSKIKVNMLSLIPAQGVNYTDVFYDSNNSIYRFYGQNKPLLVSYNFDTSNYNMVPLAANANYRILKIIKHSTASSAIVVIANGVNKTITAGKLGTDNVITGITVLDYLDYNSGQPFGFAILNNRYLITQNNSGFVSFDINNSFTQHSIANEETDIPMFLLNERYGIYGKTIDEFTISFGILVINNNGIVQVEGLEYPIEYPILPTHPFISNI